MSNIGDAITDSAGAVAVIARRVAESPVHLVLLDINMPVSGWQILRGLRADPRLAALPVAMLSSSQRPEDVGLAAALGVRAYLAKPGTYADILALVPRIVELAREG